MVNDFYQSFDDGTILKLEVFRKYIREWLPVFMTDSARLNHLSSVNIFDFFAGPGVDRSGNQGTPLIIIEEIKKYCESRGSLKRGISIHLYFNDINGERIQSLQSNCQRFLR
jgi:three-Cys-motif partner protein